MPGTPMSEKMNLPEFNSNTYKPVVSNKAKIIFLFLIVIVMVGFGYFNRPKLEKDTASVEQIKALIEEQGYIPKDITEQYFNKNSDSKEFLLCCISFDDVDLHFEFFNFTNSGKAVEIYEQVYDSFTQDLEIGSDLRNDISSGNYKIYTLEYGEKYKIAVQVENTVLYAICPVEQKSIITDILSEINYLTPELDVETSA